MVKSDHQSSGFTKKTSPLRMPQGASHTRLTKREIGLVCQTLDVMISRTSFARR